MPYKLSDMLRLKLKKLGLSDQDIEMKIIEYEEEAVVFINMRLGAIQLEEKQVELLSNNYIQYQLFSFLEMESFVADKRDFLENLIEDIIKNEKEKDINKKEKNRSNTRIKIF